MIVTECILKSKIFYDERTGYTPTLIQILDSGGIVCTELSKNAANAYITERGLVPEDPKKYDIQYGKIYTDGNFWDYVQNNKEVKYAIIASIAKLEKC